MAVMYAYHYAVIDETTGMCMGYDDTSVDCSDDPTHVLIDEWQDDYLFKFYNRADGKWYEDAEFTIEWIPA